MTTYDQLLQALEQSRAGYDQSYAALGPLEQKRQEYSTKRSRGIIPMMVESVWDHFKQKKYEPQYQKALLEAMSSARGVDKAQAQADSYAQDMAKRQEEAQAQAAYFQQRGDEQSDDIRDFDQSMQLAGEKERMKAQYRAPTQPQAPSYHDFVNPESGATHTYTMNPDGTRGRDVGMSKPAPTDKTQEPMSLTNKAEYSSKLADIDDSLKLIDEAEAHIKGGNVFQGTGPLDQLIPGRYNQTTQNLADQLYAVAKRVYKVPGEGVFTDRDALDLRGMLFGPGKYEKVNLEAINRVRGMLISRKEMYSSIVGEQGGEEDIDALIRKYSGQ